MNNIEFQILGVGAWGPRFQNWNELSDILLAKSEGEQGATKAPKPEVIPANERRRAPLPVRLAVESSWQAVQNADLDPVDLPCVFVSGIGDTQLTDYMCKALASENKALSPTKFHNSVHNAAAGYWTISTGCMQAANSVAGYQESVSLTLMEALIQCQSENKPFLLTFYDAPSSEVLKELLKNEESFSASIVVAPKDWSEKHRNYTAYIENQGCDWPKINSTDILENIYSTNPSAKILALLKLLVDVESLELKSVELKSISMPMSSQSRITISY